jgi:Putative MetA-pathway of phenol degradation
MFTTSWSMRPQAYQLVPYQLTRLSALGLGHWAVDGGVGYTYLNEKAGIEGSVVFGLTYNFINPYTQYQSGTDAHLDWALSPILTDKFHIGAVGYFYNQITGDSGDGARLGDFKSRVAGIGPQIGFFIPFFDREAYLNLRTYSEFDAKNRLEGWNAFVTFSIEASGQKEPAVGEVLILLGIWRGASFADLIHQTGFWRARQRSTPWRRDYLLRSAPVKS